MKDRLIKRLQDQIKALQTHVTGKTLHLPDFSFSQSGLILCMFHILISQSESSTGRAQRVLGHVGVQEGG